MTFAQRMGVLAVGVIIVAGAGAYYEHGVVGNLGNTGNAGKSAPKEVPAHLKMAYQQAASRAADDTPTRPDFTINDLSGQPVSPARWDGQVVLYNFWAAWCPPCRREIPVFNEVREFYQDDGFEVVGIAIDEQAAVEKFLSGLGDIDYPQLISVDDGMQVLAEYGNASGGLPYSVLVDRQKRIRYVKQGELEKGELIAQLEALLSEAP